MMDGVINRLIAAYESAGLPPVRPPGREVSGVLAQLNAEIYPLRLPAQVELFWRRVDPTSLAVAPHPAPASAELALQTWRSHADDQPGMTPRLLFPVCYESHSFVFVELDAPGRHGGACFAWMYGGAPFRIVFADLAAYLDLLTAMIQLGETARQTVGDGTCTVFDPDRRWGDYQAARLSSALPLPGWGTTVELAEDLRTWPPHWLASSGLEPVRHRGRAGMTTIADLVHEADGGVEARGTIRARVIRLVGSGAGRRVAVDDGSGLLDMWCPARVCTYGPVIAREFEFDVIVQAAPSVALDVDGTHERVLRAADSGDLSDAQDAVAEMYAQVFGMPARAEATVIRPLD